VPAIAALEKLSFDAPVTFFVGENGSGKSTLLEAIAVGANLPTVGGEDVERDESLVPARQLARSLRFGWKKRAHRGFFLRAEDFFNYAKRLRQTQNELGELAASYQRELQDNPDDEGLKRAHGSVLAQQNALTNRYGENLDARSHGESFMHLFSSRLVPGGLYLLDEPEAALSPLRQLAFLSQIKSFVAQDCQFIVATHSPILMAHEGAQIFGFDDGEIKSIAFDDVPHVVLMRGFLSDPQAFLRRL
jgi:predicted ATPase